MKLKKIAATILSGVMVVSLAACGNSDNTANDNTKTTAAAVDTTNDSAGSADSAGDTEQPQPTGGVELEVVTTFAGNDGNAKTYKSSTRCGKKKQAIESRICLQLPMTRLRCGW